MIADRESPPQAEPTPAVAPRFTLVVVLSMLLGILLTVAAVGAILHYRQSQALQTELSSVRAILKQKDLALERMSEQFEALSKQMHMLREYSVARSSSTGGKGNKTESPEASAAAVGKGSALPDANGKAGSAKPSSPPKVQKPKLNPQNCGLVGKSPEEQAATLKRCVDLIDTPK